MASNLRGRGPSGPTRQNRHAAAKRPFNAKHKAMTLHDPCRAESPRLHVLVLPGWQSSGPRHWQSRWEALYGDVRVEQSDWMHPLRGDWMMRLGEGIGEVEGEGGSDRRARGAGGIAAGRAGRAQPRLPADRGVGRAFAQDGSRPRGTA